MELAIVKVDKYAGLSYIAFLSTIQYQYNTFKYWDNTIQYNTLQYNTIQYNIH